MKEKPSPTIKPLRRMFRLLHLERRLINYIYLYAIVAGLINLTLPLGIQAILNFLQAGTVSSSWWILIFAVTIGTVMAGVLVVMQMSVSESLQRRIFTNVAFDFAKRLPELRYESVRDIHLPEIVNRFFDTLTLQKGLPKILIDFSTAAMQIFFGLLLLSFYHPLFIFFGITLVLILVLILRVTGPYGLKTSLNESKYKYRVAYWLEEVARTLQTFKLAGASQLPLQNTDKYVSGYLDAKRKHFKILYLQYSAIIGFKALITFILLALGGWLVLNNQLNIGQFIAAEIIIILIMNSAEKMIMSMDTIYDVLTALDKIGSIVDLPLEKNEGKQLVVNDDDLGISVEMQNLSYQFPDSPKPILQDINLKVHAGEKVCIIGYNGSGKTTLIQIISCFLSDYEGNILYNGIPRGNLESLSLRAHIGDFSAQEDIFAGSLMDNIGLGYAKMTLQEIVKVCQLVGLADYVAKMPEGYQTQLMPGGANLPRSVRVKIILARSIAINPKMLAIEELMANLEQADRDNLSNLLTDPKRKWTLIAVTDDRHFAQKCQRVIVLKDGKIVADGSYDTIIQTEHAQKIFRNA